MLATLGRRIDETLGRLGFGRIHKLKRIILILSLLKFAARFGVESTPGKVGGPTEAVVTSEGGVRQPFVLWERLLGSGRSPAAWWIGWDACDVERHVEETLGATNNWTCSYETNGAAWRERIEDAAMPHAARLVRSTAIGLWAQAPAAACWTLDDVAPSGRSETANQHTLLLIHSFPSRFFKLGCCSTHKYFTMTFVQCR